MNAFEEPRSSSGVDRGEDCAGFRGLNGVVAAFGDDSSRDVVASECFLLEVRMLGVEIVTQVRWVQVEH